MSPPSASSGAPIPSLGVEVWERACAGKGLGLGALSLLAVLGSLGCSHVVEVRSDPPGARVSVDGQHLGVAPVRFEEALGAEPHLVVAEKEGFGPTTLQVERSELALGPALGLGAVAATCAGLGCAGGAMLANPTALAGLCGGCFITFVNAELGCQTACAGLSLLSLAPSLWTAPGMALGGFVGGLPLGGLWWLGQSPDVVEVKLEPLTAARNP